MLQVQLQVHQGPSVQPPTCILRAMSESERGRLAGLGPDSLEPSRFPGPARVDVAADTEFTCVRPCVCGLGSGQCRHEAFGHMSAVSSANGQHVHSSGKMAASSASSITMPMPSGSRREENDVRSAGREARGRPARHTAALVEHKHKHTAASTLTGHRARTQLSHQRLQGL